MKKLLIIVSIVVSIVGVGAAIFIYGLVFTPNVKFADSKTEYLYIPSDADYDDLLAILEQKEWLINKESFKQVAEKKNYSKKIKAGKYHLTNGMTNNELVNLLRSGKQVPVKVTFNNIRTIEELAGKITKNIEADSALFVNLLKDASFTSKYGFSPTKISCLFLPDTYEMYWNTTAEALIQRMANYYKKFWTDSRKQQASAIGLSQSEVSILASIVQSEQARHNDEKPIIAGLYLNRLHKNIPLQSDPTLIYALGDFTIKRVLNKDKEVESPYNTYKYAGLTPGPINIPEKSSVLAVLNAQKHNYIYMCAKEDFSGYHNFSKTLQQHNIYAQRYWAALNKRKIKR